MPRVGASIGAKAHAKSAATKQQTKSSKPRGKDSALQEATEVAPKAVTSSGDAPADTGASSRRNRSPSLPKDDGPNPRFAVREHSSGTVAEARAEHDGSHSEEAAGESTPLPSEGGRKSVQSLGSDHGGRSPMSPADEAMDSPNTRSDEDEKPRRVLRTFRSLRVVSELRLPRRQSNRASTPRSGMLLGYHAVRRWRPSLTLTITSSAQTLKRKRVLSTSLRRYRTISTGSRRTSKLPSECGSVLRRGPTRQVTTAHLLAKEERCTREGIGLQSPAPVLSSTWSSSLHLVGSLEGTPPRVRTSALWCSGTRCSRRTSRVPGACFSHRTEFL
ncbi:hypothetical protein PI125_g10862 [Phytophthora idaei]|nr:hypothetical protein PI125_g10862 [Phytophthora idaei]KAG3149755.1 hypothetical protein PI126_g11849 [Phytophthora idaei]